MFRAFIRLAIGLAREAEFHQLRAHRIGTDRMPHLGQGCGELLHALRDPDQGSHGIAQRRGLHQALERGDKPRIILRKRTTPATGSANPSLRQRWRSEILLATIDRRTGEPGNFRDNRETASTSAPHLGRRKQAPPTLVKPGADRLPAQAESTSSIMRSTYACSPNQESPKTESIQRTTTAIQLLFEGS